MYDSFGTSLRACREQRGISLRALASRVLYDPGYVSRVENGRRLPSSSFVDACDEALGMDGALTKLATDGAAPSQVQALASPPIRFEQGEVIAVAARRASKFLAGHGEIDRAAMEQLHDDVRTVARAYPQRPLTELLPGLAESQDTLFRLCDERQRPGQAKTLYFLAGVTSGLMAKASHDQANPHAAATQARAAWLCADRAEHPALRAWIRGLQSLVAYWAGRNRDALRYAQQGSAEETRSTVAVWLASCEARAWAALGNRHEASEAIARAEEAWERVVEDDLDELGGICTFGRTRQAYYAADALAWVDPHAASYHAEAAIEGYEDTDNPEWAFGDQAGAYADLAIARIGAGQYDGAAEALAPVLALPAEQRINGIIISTRRVYDALRLRGHGESELAEAIEDFTRIPLATT